MTVILPSGITTAPPEQDIFVVRGDQTTLTIGFTGVEDVVANPAAHRLRLVFRRRQTDVLPDLLVVIATLDTDPGEQVNGTEVEVIATFEMQPSDTLLLPPTGCAYFIEWTDSVGGSNRRVFQGRAQVGD